MDEEEYQREQREKDHLKRLAAYLVNRLEQARFSLDATLTFTYEDLDLFAAHYDYEVREQRPGKYHARLPEPEGGYGWKVRIERKKR
jgi:hypothetical protein